MGAREGLEGPQRQPNKGRLWLDNGSCVRLRPEHPNHIWSCGFVADRTQDGRTVRMLNVADAFPTRAWPIRVARKLKATDVIDVLSDLFMPRAECPAPSASTTGPSWA